MELGATPETSHDAVSFAARVRRFFKALKGNFLPDFPRVYRTQVRWGSVLTLHGMRFCSDQKYQMVMAIGPSRRDRGKESRCAARLAKETARKERSQAQE